MVALRKVMINKVFTPEVAAHTCDEVHHWYLGLGLDAHRTPHLVQLGEGEKKGEDEMGRNEEEGRAGIS